VDREGAVATVIVDRADAMNALDRPTLEELRDRLAEVADDTAVGVVVLTGAGDRAFVAGADIKYMSGLGAEEALAWGELGHHSAQLLETMPKPTIAAINGFATSATRLRPRSSASRRSTSGSSRAGAGRSGSRASAASASPRT
jgi:enoyl-CoA hydratase